MALLHRSLRHPGGQAAFAGTKLGGHPARTRSGDHKRGFRDLRPSWYPPPKEAGAIMTRLFAIVSLAILAAACGGGSKGAPGLGDGGTTYTPATTTQQFIDRIVDAECESMVRCGSLPDKSTCLDFFNMANANFSSLAYSIDSGRVTRNPSAEAACFQAIASIPCSRDEAGDKTLTTACQNVLVGTIASGGDCIDDTECKSGLECDEGSCTASCCAGICVTKKPLSEVGGSCTGDSNCVDAAYCKQSYNSTTQEIEGVCLARVATGSACTDYGSCASNAECVSATGSQTCVALAKDGASCASGVSCENIASYCDPAKSTCQPRLRENAACVLPDAGASAAFSAGCLGYSECKNGVCKRLPTAGQACSNPDAAVLDECFLVGKCVDGVCQADPPEPVCTVAVAKAAAADAGANN
jgi:hypothetical protein